MEHWYALYIKPGYEKKVADTLQRKGFETFCPVKPSKSQYWWFLKKSEEVIFTSKLFVKTTEDRLHEVKECNGVINLLYWLKDPAIIQENDILMIKDFIQQHNNVQVEKTTVGVKQKVVPMDKYNDLLNRKIFKIEIPALGMRLCAPLHNENYQLNVAENDYAPQLNFEPKKVNWA